MLEIRNGPVSFPAQRAGRRVPGRGGDGSCTAASELRELRGAPRRPHINAAAARGGGAPLRPPRSARRARPDWPGRPAGSRQVLQRAGSNGAVDGCCAVGLAGSSGAAVLPAVSLRYPRAGCADSAGGTERGRGRGSGRGRVAQCLACSARVKLPSSHPFPQIATPPAP